MTAWDIVWRIGLFVVVPAVCLAVVAISERRAAEKFDTDWSER